MLGQRCYFWATENEMKEISEIDLQTTDISQGLGMVKYVSLSEIVSRNAVLTYVVQEG
jgi:hypothetical protein